MEPDINPFIYGRPVSPSEFLGRKKELRRLFQLLVKRQSAAIVGPPNCGKTSLLAYVPKAEMPQFDFIPQISQYIFSFLDAHGLHDIKTRAAFWEMALAPLADLSHTVQACNLSHLITEYYEDAQKNEFGTFWLQRLFKELDASGSRFVLLLDEFDNILTHSLLNSAEFYGKLRTLAQHAEGFVLVIAARRDTEQLSERTQPINPTGSPYFNTFVKIDLGVFSDQELSTLLDLAGGRFGRKDRKFVMELSGRHPYLAQAAAASLWDAHEEGLRGTELHTAAAHSLRWQTTDHFADTWELWTEEARRAAAAVAFSQLPRQLGDHKFDTEGLMEGLADYVPELRSLKANGLCAEVKPGEWAITQHAFLWYLVDEIARTVRDKNNGFDGWLLKHKIEWSLTKEKRERIGEAAKGAWSFAGKGVTSFIEAFAKGLSGSDD